MEKLQLLESILGKGKKSNRDYYQFMCPFHAGKHGEKLGISLGTGVWKCWACPSKGKTVTGLLSKLNAPQDKIKLSKVLWKDRVEFHIPEPEKSLELPKEFKPLWEFTGSFFYEKAKNYVTGRGVTEKDIIKHRLGYCEHGKYQDMIIFPSYNENGQLTFFSGRSYADNPSRKFAIPINLDKNIIHDENQINWHEPVIIVESKLDAIVVRRNSEPLYGKVIGSTLKAKIIQEKPPKLIFCLDGDALEDAMRQARYFIENGTDCYKVELPVDEEESLKHGHTVWHDPTSLGHEKVWQYIDAAAKITESDNFKFKILNRLK